ncbi:hypothetical protein FOT41_23690, partial [Citrobacter freundii]|nr:hypothetical protein [Citrobacter freundii]
MHQPHNLVDITRAGDPNVRRLLAVHSLPWRGMNRRLIVQFDPDEPSMSAPTFAEPDQGPLAGGRKVNARHDLTRRSAGVATAKFREGFREGDCASQIS